MQNQDKEAGYWTEDDQEDTYLLNNCTIPRRKEILRTLANWIQMMLVSKYQIVDF